MLVVLCVAFAVALGVTLYNKIKGKSGCDCGGSCDSCGVCGKAKTSDKQNMGNLSCGDCPHCAMCKGESAVDG